MGWLLARSRSSPFHFSEARLAGPHAAQSTPGDRTSAVLISAHFPRVGDFYHLGVAAFARVVHFEGVSVGTDDADPLFHDQVLLAPHRAIILAFERDHFAAATAAVQELRM
jgi:hypothetical protein